MAYSVTQRERLRALSEEAATAASASRGKSERDAMASAAPTYALLAISHALEALRLEIRAGAER